MASEMHKIINKNNYLCYFSGTQAIVIALGTA